MLVMYHAQKICQGKKFIFFVFSLSSRSLGDSRGIWFLGWPLCICCGSSALPVHRWEHVWCARLFCTLRWVVDLGLLRSFGSPKSLWKVASFDKPRFLGKLNEHDIVLWHGSLDYPDVLGGCHWAIGISCRSVVKDDQLSTHPTGYFKVVRIQAHSVGG